MEILIIMSLLSGWLVTELKDFILIGGIQNSFAFILLKIIFISTCIAICIIMVTAPSIILHGFNKCFQDMRLDIPEQETEKLAKKQKYTVTTTKRLNNFLRSTSNHSS